MTHSSDATASVRTGEPVCPGLKSAPLNLSEPLVAKRRASCSWRVLKIFTANDFARTKGSWHLAAAPRQTRKSGGCRDNDEKALAVKPHRSPSWSMVVVMVTPLGHIDITAR